MRQQTAPTKVRAYAQEKGQRAPSSPLVASLPTGRRGDVNLIGWCLEHSKDHFLLVIRPLYVIGLLTGQVLYLALLKLSIVKVSLFLLSLLLWLKCVPRVHVLGT